MLDIQILTDRQNRYFQKLLLKVHHVSIHGDQIMKNFYH